MTTIHDQYRQTFCRICQSAKLVPFLDLGAMPIPNGFLSQSQLSMNEARYPLATVLCPRCGLVQLTHVVPAERMFKNYLYIPSTSRNLLDHFKKIAREIIDSAHAKQGELVVDIGSNDGTLLSFFKTHGMKILGIDPAENIVAAANENGIPTINDYFSKESAQRIKKKYGKAKIITATNVIAHIDDIHDTFDGIRLLLARDGLFVMEAPYLVDLLKKNEFDTIYHEHLSYFAIRPLTVLAKKHKLRIIDIYHDDIHGGTVRVYFVHEKSQWRTQPSVRRFLAKEKILFLDKPEPYVAFAGRVARFRHSLRKRLADLKKEKHIIAGYGAAAKGNVLMHSCGITADMLDFVVDSISYKHGKFTPGNHIPIYPEERLLELMPDYVLILAWNFADEIIAKNQEYRARGGKFIVPHPRIRIV